MFCSVGLSVPWVERQRSLLTGKEQFHPRFIQIHLCTVQCFIQFLPLVASPLSELQELLGSEGLLRAPAAPAPQWKIAACAELRVLEARTEIYGVVIYTPAFLLSA